MNRSVIFHMITALLISGPIIGEVDPVINAKLEWRSHTYQGTTLPYRLYIPKNYQPSAEYPLLLFLHGALWSGTDNEKQLDNEFAVYWVQDCVQVGHPSFVVYPQCPAGSSWESASGIVSDFPPDPEMETVDDLIDSLIREFAINENSIYIAGKSMGGQGVYGMLSRYPDRFAAAVIAAGPYVYHDISEISHIPLWLLHARYDDVIPVEQSRHMVQELEASGKSFIYTHCNFHSGDCGLLSPAEIDRAIQEGIRFFYSEFDTSGHQIEPKVVRTYGLHQWVFLQHKESTGITTAPIPESSILFMNYPNPFNQRTAVSYRLSAVSRVRIKVLNSRGKEVVRLLDERQRAGNYRVLFDASGLASGIYLAELSTGDGVLRIKMILVK